MPLVLMEARHKISAICKGLSLAIHNELSNSDVEQPEEITIGKDNTMTPQETQEHWKSSPLGKALGISRLLK